MRDGWAGADRDAGPPPPAPRSPGRAIRPGRPEPRYRRLRLPRLPGSRSFRRWFPCSFALPGERRVTLEQVADRVRPLPSDRGLTPEILSQIFAFLLGEPIRHPVLEVRALHQSARRCPQRLLERLVHVHDQALGREAVSHATAVAHELAVVDLPERPVAFGAGEVRRLADAVQVDGQLALIVTNLRLLLLGRRRDLT